MSNTMPEPIQVLITVKFDAESLAAFRDVSPKVDILYHPAQDIKDVPDEIWAKAEVLYTSGIVPDETLAPKLHWIHAHSAGIDHLLEYPLIHAEQVRVTTASGIHATNITEYVFMMLLAFGHRLPEIMAHQAKAHWPDERRFITFMPLELRGSTLGIVGYGSIGREIARVANTFGMEVLATKRNVREPGDPTGYVIPGTGDPDGQHFHRLYPPEALNTMVRECDFVVLTLPLTNDTRGSFNRETFEAMKNTAYLVNVGRGGVVDEEALLYALQHHQIAGAALDVFESEPLPEDSPLWKQPNLIISPHISGNTADYNEKAAALFIENLQRYIMHRDLLNVVDVQKGY